VAELLSSDDLAVAVAEPHVLALATAQQLAAALAAREARVCLGSHFKQGSRFFDEIR